MAATGEHDAGRSEGRSDQPPPDPIGAGPRCLEVPDASDAPSDPDQRPALEGLRRQPGRERESAEESLRAASRALRVYARIFDGSPDLISVVDRRFVYRMANPTLATMHGLRPEELVGRTMAEMHGEDTFESLIRPFVDRCFAGESVRDEVWLAFRAAGRRCLDTRYYPLQADGPVEYAVVLARDVTEHKLAEERQQEQVSLISHDMQQPLTVLMGHASWLHRLLSQHGLEREASSAESILRSARHIRSMTQDIVESARLESGRMEMRKRPVDLAYLFPEVAEHVGSARERARIQVECPERLPPVLADPDRIQRVLVNLVTNALKYSPSREPVVIRATRGEREILVSVVDRGVGILPEDVPRLFAKFYRARTGRKAEGSGLGLYIARLIVESHGGRIWVESQLGQGSAFHFALPVA